MSFRVIAEAQAQVLVDDTVELFTPAIKIDEIRAVVQSLNCHVIPGKVIFQGVLHKQIFFVNGDNTVRHQAVDIPFSGFVDIALAEPGQCCQLLPQIAFIDFNLIDPLTLREITVIDLTIRLLEGSPLENVFCNSTPIGVFRQNDPQVFVAGGAKAEFRRKG